MTKCEHWDAGWCYAPDDVKTNALGSGVCNLPEYCPYLKSQNKMNEIQQTKEDIAILQEKLKKLELLKEMENKSSAEKAYCEVYGEYPRSCARWNGFLTGYDLGYIHGAEGKDKFVPHQEHFGLKLGN